MRGLDFTNWHSLLLTLLGLALVTLIGMGIRLVMMFTIQQRRERMNRQINERLKTLIAAYKVLGGSFTGDLTVDPTHKRDLSRRNASDGEAGLDLSAETAAGSERTRRLDSDAAAVQLVTIHGSKGLEYPVVYLPTLWNRFVGNDPEIPLFHDDEGRPRHFSKSAPGASSAMALA